MKKIYMLAGKAGSGKNLVASYLEEFYREKNIKACNLQISMPLKYYANKVLDWDFNEETKPREFLQNIGVDVIRKQMGENFLIERLIEDIKILFNYVDVVVVSDVRLPHEFEEVKKHFDNVTNILVTRENFENNLTDEQRKHLTEVALDNYDNYDYIIKNDGSESDLKEKISSIFREVS